MIYKGLEIYTSNIYQSPSLPPFPPLSPSPSIQGSFDVLPAVIEVSLDCFQYWIIAVSVVAGLLVLIILIAALACVSLKGVRHYFFMVK